MSQVQPQPQGPVNVNRVFEQPADAMVCYSDLAQIIGTGGEVVLQFYESVPGPPSGPAGQIQSVRSRLRATVIVNPAHAVQIGRNLLTQIGHELPPTPPAAQGGTR